MMREMRDVEDIVIEVERVMPSLKTDETYQKLVAFLRSFPRDTDREVYDMRLDQLQSYVNQQMEQLKSEPLWRELPAKLQHPTGVHIGQSFGREVYLPLEYLTRHWEIQGTTGSGKTNLMMYVFSQLPRCGIGSWLIDFMSEYRDLEGHGYEVIEADDLRINPLNLLPENGPRRNLAVFARVFVHSQALLYGSRNYLRVRASELYEWYRQYEEWPTLEDLRIFLTHYPEKGSDYRGYRDRSLVRLESLMRQDGHILDVQQGFHPADLVDRNVVFDLRELADETRVLLAECLLAMNYECLRSRGRQGRLQCVVGMDEAKHVWNRQREQSEQQERPYNTEFLAEVRKYGGGAVLADHEPTQLTHAAAALTNMKSMMQLGNRGDVRQMLETLRLDERQSNEAHRLQRGEMVFKLSNTLPNKVTVPKFDPKR